MSYMRWINGYNFHMYWKSASTQHKNQEVCVIMNPEFVAVEMNYLEIKKHRAQVKQRITDAFKNIDKKNWQKINASLNKFVTDIEEEWEIRKAN